MSHAGKERDRERGGNGGEKETNKEGNENRGF
jgi:hypothetical protein